jgi:hypothetical protein
MANLDAPFGLRPIKYADGSPYDGVANPYFIPSSDSTAVYIYDPVIKTGTSNTAAVTVSGATGGGAHFPIGALPVVTRATNGDDNRITGVVVAVGYDTDDDSRAPYRKASTNAVVWVVDDPRVLFEIQADGAVGAASVGLNAVLIGTGGSTVTGLSSVELDTTSDVPAADASNQLLIKAISRDPMRNDTGASNTCVHVTINRHTEAPDQVLGIA